MSSAFLTRKLKRGFDRFDSSHDGVLEISDFTEAADRVSVAFGYSLTSPEADGMREVWEVMWRGLIGPMDRDGDDKVSFEEFDAALGGLVADDPDGYERFLADCVNALVDMGDRDGDDKLSAEEFDLLYTSMLGLTREQTAVAFAHLDTDRDGALTREELHQAIGEYWGGDDEEANGNWLLGPLD